MLQELFNNLKGFLLAKVTAIVTVAVTGFLIKNNIDDPNSTIVGWAVSAAVGIVSIVLSLVAHKLALQANVQGVTNVSPVPQKESFLGTK